MNCYRCTNAVRCIMLGAEIHPGMNYQLRVKTGQGDRRGEGIMPEVSWTSDKDNGGVSVLVEPFRTTFVFGINSSGRFLPAPGIIDRQPGGGMSMIGVLGGWGRHTNSRSEE